MPLGPGNEHLSEKLLRQYEVTIERPLARQTDGPRERVALLIRQEEIEKALGDADLDREERKRLRDELRDLREALEDLEHEKAGLTVAIEKARREWQAAVAAEGTEALARLAAEMDVIVDRLLDRPRGTWRDDLDAAKLLSALAQRWLSSMGEPTNARKIVGGFPLYVRIPMWDRPANATLGDFIRWIDMGSQRAQARLAAQEAR